MKKLVVTEFISVDGVFEAPGGDSDFKYAGWTFPYGNEEFGAFKLKELQEAQSLLLGRITYEGFAKAWPERTDEAGFADKFNSMPKYVVSKTLKEASWNNSKIISKNVVEEIKKLKKGRGGDIFVHGSGQLTRFLLENGLVDQLTLMVFPVVLGEGMKLFEGMKKTALKLVKTQTFATGVVVLQYQPERK